MTELSLARCLSAAGLAALVSCAAPKAVAVADPPKNKQAAATDVSGGSLPKPFASRVPQDGIRLPDNFLSMPGDTEFRPTVPASTSVSAGAVTVRPPSDPVIPSDIGPKNE